MLAFIASAYFISSGRVKLIPAFRPDSEFAFPYKGEELWARITNEISEKDELADEIDEEAIVEQPVAEIADTIAGALFSLTMQQREQEDS